MRHAKQYTVSNVERAIETMENCTRVRAMKTNS